MRSVSGNVACRTPRLPSKGTFTQFVIVSKSLSIKFCNYIDWPCSSIFQRNVTLERNCQDLLSSRRGGHRAVVSAQQAMNTTYDVAAVHAQVSKRRKTNRKLLVGRVIRFCFRCRVRLSSSARCFFFKSFRPPVRDMAGCLQQRTADQS